MNHRQAVQWSERLAFGLILIGTLGRLHGAVGDQSHDRIDLGIDAFDLLQMRREGLSRAQLLGADEAAVLPGQSHRLATGLVDQRDDVLVDGAARCAVYHLERNVYVLGVASEEFACPPE